MGARGERPDPNTRSVTTITIVAGTSPVRMVAEVTLPSFARGIVVIPGVGAVGRRRGAVVGEETVIERIRRYAEVGTLAVELLAPEEDAVARDGPISRARRDASDARLEMPEGVDVALLAERLSAATDWVLADEKARHLPIGYFASGVGAAAALVAASSRSEVRAVVCRAGRPDLAGPALEALRAPTLFIVAEMDDDVSALNRSARGRMRAESELAVIPDAGPAFDSPLALEELSRRASEWFAHHLC